MKSKLIALSAISSALVAIILTFGAYLQLVDIFAVTLSSVFVTLPLYHKSYKACILTYLVGGVIAFMISGFNVFSIVFPSYFLYFGIYPILQNKFMEKGKKGKILGTILSAIWFIAFAYGIYFYYTAFMGLQINDLPMWISDNIYYFISVFALLFYAIFNRFIYVVNKLSNQLLQRIIK